MRDIQKIHQFSRKVGFGFRPDESIPSDPYQWIDQQLKEPRRYVGIASLKTPNQVEQWPEEYSLDIYERFNLAWNQRAKEIELNERKDLTADQISEAFWKFSQETLPNWHDETRLYHRGIYASDQIRQRFLHFWANHFFVSGETRSNALLGDHIERAIEESLDGTFGELVLNAAVSPAMLKYLDNTENVGENSKKAKWEREKNKVAGLNDNLAREILELHTVSPEMGYTEDDIRSVAKVLSGWGLHTGSHNWRGKGVRDFYRPFIPEHAQRGIVEVFGLKLGSQFGTTEKGLKPLLTYLAEHDESIHHLSKKLCIHFISDDPPVKSIARVQKVWRDTNGSLPEVHRQVLIEAWETLGNEAKFLWPFTWALQAMRQTGASIVDGWDDVNKSNYGFLSSANRISRELSQGFYTERRQPNGFSLIGKDWISPAHFERRLKFSLLIGRHGKPALSPDEFISRLQMGDGTKRIADRFVSLEKKWVALLCDQQLLEV